MFEDRDSELADLLAEIRRIEVQSNRLVTEVMAGGYSSVFAGAGIEFDEVREYAEGDDPRSVDWNVSARLGRPFIKKFVDERELTVMFLFDLSASMGSGFGVWSARQMAVRICACLALSAVRNNDKVGLIAFGGTVDRFVPPQSGLGHALRVVRDCLALQPGRPGNDFIPPLELAAKVLRRRSIVFLVSDFFADGWQKVAALCARRHDLVAVRLLAPELAPPDARLMRMRDPETGRITVVDWSSDRVRVAWNERVSAWRRHTEEALEKAKVDRMDVPIPRTRDRHAVARPILEFFRMRELRGAKR